MSRLPTCARRAAGLAILAALAVPAAVGAHPLGNFTVNVYAGIHVSASEIRIDAVLDQAEIPTFQERLRLDSDGDGELSDDEVLAAQQPECAALAGGLDLSIDGARIGLELTATGLSFPPGAGGLSTMRLVCELVAPMPASSAAATTIEFVDRFQVERLGWREIVVTGDGVTVASALADRPVRAVSVSGRLTSYPPDLLSRPLSDSSVAFRATGGGPAAPLPSVPDAAPLPGTVPAPVTPVPSGAPPAGAAASFVPQGAAPGGVGAEIPALFSTADVSPAVLLMALATAVFLGAAHALTPGHGKTLVAAYLVGSRGSGLQAAVLGLVVSVSHTLGILALAALVVIAQTTLPPDVVVRALPAVAALGIVAIGGWMLIGEARRRLSPLPVQHSHGHPRVQAVDAEPASWRRLLGLGLAGGLVPSTSALLILLGAIGAGRAAFGVVLILAFGLGMAVVLAAVGLAIVRARTLIERVTPESVTGRLSAAVSLVAAVVVFGAGVWLLAQAIAAAPVL